MALTTLIAEVLFIGCQSWACIFALLYRVHFLNDSHYEALKVLAKDHFGGLAFLVVLLAYPLGTMVNLLCYKWANRLFADRINKPLFEDLDHKTFNPIYVYVLQFGSERLLREIDAFAASGMRLSRAAVLNFIVLGAVLFSWFTVQTFVYSLICLGIGLLGIPTFYFIASEWKGEFVAAYKMLRARADASSSGATTSTRKR
jgi:hypothetical protein